VSISSRQICARCLIDRQKLPVTDRHDYSKSSSDCILFMN
jgi:hypothetical protein